MKVILSLSGLRPAAPVLVAVRFYCCVMPAFAAFATRADGTIQQDHYVIATFVC